MRSELEDTYSKIWEKYTDSSFKEVLSRGNAFHHDEDEKDCDVLFVGINPSFKEGSKIGSSFFNRDAPHPYFKPFNIIHKELSVNIKNDNYKNWTHIDILAIKETNQKFIKSLMKTTTGIDFVMDQILVARQRILYIKPKIIVVCNAQARVLMGKDRSIDKKNIERNIWMDFNFEFNDEFGSYRIKDIPELEHTHVLFSSMLSGQGALDLGSRERLVWQMGRIFK